MSSSGLSRRCHGQHGQKGTPARAYSIGRHAALDERWHRGATHRSEYNLAMNEHPSALVFTFCTLCSATFLLSEAKSHVCRPSRVPVAACAVEVPMPLHIHQGGDPGRPSQLRPELIATTTSTAPPPSSVGQLSNQGGPNGGPNGGPMGRFVSRSF